MFFHHLTESLELILGREIATIFVNIFGKVINGVCNGILFVFVLDVHLLLKLLNSVLGFLPDNLDRRHVDGCWRWWLMVVNTNGWNYE